MPFCAERALNTVSLMSPSRTQPHDGLPPRRPCPQRPTGPFHSAASEDPRPGARSSERGLVSVEYLVTALLAAALIAVLAAVPLASSPTVSSNFEAAVCSIFGGGCEQSGGGEQNPEETTPEMTDPNDEVPTCMVSREEEAGSGSGSGGIFEIGGGWMLREDVNSDGSISLTLISEFEGSVGPKMLDVKKGDNSAKAKAEVNIGYQQGDTWKVDNQEEADRLRQELEDWTVYNMLNDGSGTGDFFAGMFGGPEAPRDPDTKRYTVELGGGAELKGNLGFDVDEVISGSLGANISGELSGQVGVEVAADGTITLILQRKVSVDGGIDGGLTGDDFAELDGSVGGNAGFTELIRLELDENFDPKSISIRQVGDVGWDAGMEGGFDLSGGDKGKHKDDEAKDGYGMGGNRQYWWDLDVDFSQIPPEERDEALLQYFADPRPLLVPDLMYRGVQPYHSGSAEFFYEHGQLRQNIYDISESSDEHGYKFAGFGVEWDSSNKNYELVESEYALPIENGDRQIAINTDCVG